MNKLKMNKGGVRTLNIILSVLVSFTAWFYVAYDVSPTITKTYHNIPITFEGEYELGLDGLGVIKSDHDDMDITVTLPRTEVARISVDNFKAKVDVSKLNKGMNNVPITIETVDGVNVKSQSIDSLSVETAESNNIDVDVTVGYQNDNDATTEPVATALGSKRVSVMGAEELVSKVSYVVLPINDLFITADATSTFSATPIAVDKNGHAISHVVVMPNSVRTTVYKGQLKTVPLEIEVTNNSENDKRSYTVPGTVVIKGKAAQIATINSITAKPINITDMKGGAKVKLEYELPEGVQIANASRNAFLKVIINK